MKNFKDKKVQKEVMLEYLQIMIAREDWHGVADAAMDLRDMEAEKRSYDVPIGTTPNLEIRADHGGVKLK